MFWKAWLGESAVAIKIFMFFSLICSWYEKFVAVYRQKLFNLPKAFENRQVQILYSYWKTDFLELYCELLKTSQGQTREFSNPPNMPLINNSLLKSRQHSVRHFLKLARANLTGFGMLTTNLKAFDVL
jgi:hypothetical protein